MKTLIIIFLFVGCIFEPEPQTIYKDRIVYSDTLIYVDVTDNMPLQFSDTGIFEGQFVHGFGVIFVCLAYNPTLKDWYGHPYLKIYSTDNYVEPDDGFKERDLISKSNGIFTHGIENNGMPIDTLRYVQSQSYRVVFVFMPVQYSDLKEYYYILWGVMPDGN
jgi:hypothetical protein